MRHAPYLREKARAMRVEAYREGVAEYEGLVVDPMFRDFVCLYIAEGYKRDRNIVALCNSDPAVMKLGLRWVRRLTDKPPTFWIQYHADQDRDALREFWGEALGIDAAGIRAQRKSNSNQLKGRVWRSQHGVLTVRVCETLFRARMQAWMDRIRAEWQ
jgi:hypothetical protein